MPGISFDIPPSVTFILDYQQVLGRAFDIKI